MAKKILVIDDHLNVRNILKFNLQKKGYVVITVEDAEHGLGVILKEKIDLVLLDIMLPGIDGFKVLDVLKAKNLLQKVPVVMISARGEEQDILTALKHGAKDYIVKPFNFEVLFNKIGRIVHRSNNIEPEEDEEEEEPVMLLGSQFKPFALVRVLEDFGDEDATRLGENLVRMARAGWKNILVDFEERIEIRTITLGKLVKIAQDIERESGVLQLIIKDERIMTHLKEANFIKYFTVFNSYEDAFSGVPVESK